MDDMQGLKIKICGMREASNIAEVGALRPDYMGFIFYPPSPRYCGDADEPLLARVPEDVVPVAVTVDMSPHEILDLCGRYGFNTVQLHGRETPGDCRALKDAGLSVWKAISVASEEDIRAAARYDGSTDMLVIDTAAPSCGGSGRKFDWSLLAHYDGSTPFLLSGGISPADAGAVLDVAHPRLAGVDLNSRFETAPGVKDVGTLRQFLRTLRHRDI